MIFTRLFSVIFFFTTFGIVASTPTPNFGSLELQRRDNADIMAVLENLKGSTDTILPRIAEVVDAGNVTEEALTPLFDSLTGALDQATAELDALSESDKRALVVRQSNDEIAEFVATLLSDITNALGGLVDDLATLPFLGVLLGGLDSSLNQLLRGLENLLAGLLRLVAQLLEGVARLLRQLALGLTLGALGLGL